jgi:fibronectin type 3 domain-containing protein
LDAQGNVVPTASNEISFSITGGTIIGVGNGDPNSHESDKASQRALFSGLAQVIVQSIVQPGSMTLTATSPGLNSANVILNAASTLPPPAAPASVSALAGNARVTVSWDIVPGATSYNLWRSTTQGGPYTLLAGNISGVGLGYVDQSVANGMTYFYVVSANGNGAGLNSAEVSATPMPSVAGVTATAVSSNQISLTWTAVTNATSYNVKRSATSGGPYTTIATNVTATNYSDTGASVGAGYFYAVSAVVGGSETANSAVAALSFPELTGAIIGTSGSYNNSGNTITNVFDNNLGTFFDGPTANGCWAGLDFGAGVSNVITQINYCPRSASGSRMVGGIFQGANQPNFSDAVTLYTVTTTPASGVFTPASIANTAVFRYVRYLSPNGGWGNVAELQFFGYPFFRHRISSMLRLPVATWCSAAPTVCRAAHTRFCPPSTWRCRSPTGHKSAPAALTAVATSASPMP